MTALRYTPDQLLAKYRAIRNAVSAEEFFRRPEHQKTQELWCAAHFARAYADHLEQCSVLVDDEDQQTDVDFRLELKGLAHSFQITEVQIPGRRRGDEYRAVLLGTWTHEDWSEGTTLGADWIRCAIERKLKRYAGRVNDLNLLVYLNFPAWDQQYVPIREASNDVASKFASVWLLNGNAICCISPNPALAFFEGWMVIPENLVHDEPSQETPTK